MDTHLVRQSQAQPNLVGRNIGVATLCNRGPDGGGGGAEDRSGDAEGVHDVFASVTGME